MHTDLLESEAHNRRWTGSTRHLWRHGVGYLWRNDELCRGNDPVNPHRQVSMAVEGHCMAIQA